MRQITPHAIGRAQLVAWSATFYAIPPLVPSLLDELGLAASTFGLAVTAGLVAGALASVPIGRHIQRSGGRGVMTAGSLVAALALVMLASAQSPMIAFVALVVLGAAQAALLYEPAFAALEANAQRVHAIQIITFWGGWAALAAVPLVAALAAWLGWRAALVAMSAVLLAGTLPVHARLPRRRAQVSAPACAVRLPRGLAIGFALAAFALAGLAVHGIATLVDLGASTTAASLVFAAMAPAQVASRMYFLRRAGTLAAHDRIVPFALVAAGIAAMLATPHPLALVIVAALYGAGAGLMTTVRSAVLATAVPPDQFAAVLGAMNLVLGLARAGAPFVFATLAQHAGSVVPLVTMGVLALAGGVVVWLLRDDSACAPSCAGGATCAW